ncbi:hypothetical protein KY318_00355, partial [Candidatus Woesearchaeota archaeon]|nr:hypothetical protein [Candidatus Woesearchaeota archaeon]
GATPGEPIQLVIHNYSRTQAVGNVIWQPGEFRYVNLSFSALYCGDGICSEGEDCSNCPIDCGECPPPTEGEPSQGEEEGEGEGTKRGGGTAFGFVAPPKRPCKENWVCSEWSNCSIEGIQTRICIDINNCGTNKTKPEEVRRCIYQGNCHDGIQNNGEEGIDCGGPCPPCPSCFDGIQNQGEEGVDCGGPCPPCEVKIPKVERPAVIPGMVCGNGVCEFGEECGCPRDCRRFYWQILAIVLGELLVVYVGMRGYLRLIKRLGIPRIRRAKTRLMLRRLFIWLVVLSFLYALSVVVFLFFFGSCWNLLVKYSYILMAELVIVPFVGYYILRVLEYNEKRRLRYMKRSIDVYNQELLALLRIQSQELPRIEQEFIAEAARFRKTGIGFKVFEQYIALDQIVDLIQYINQNAYTTQPGMHDAFIKMAERVVEAFQQLDEDEHLKAMLSSNEPLKQLWDKLEFIVNQYKERLELIQELEQATERFEELSEAPPLVPGFKKDEKSKGGAQREEQA